MTAEPLPARSVWLIGLMGSGKSTVGRAIAARTGRRYVDNDAVIATAAGRSTEELARDGGTRLHDWEARYVRDLVDGARAAHPVVAGIPASAADRPEDLTLLRRSGLLVYLRCRPEVLLGRVLRGAPRPWLATSPDAVEATLQRMYDARDPVLEREAHLVIDGEQPVDSVATRVTDVLGPESPGTPQDP